MDVAEPDGFRDRLDTVDGIKLDRRRTEIGVDGVDRQPELDRDFFADTAIARQLQAGDFPLAQRFRGRRLALVQRQHIDHDLAALDVLFDHHFIVENEIGAAEDDIAVTDGAEAHR